MDAIINERVLDIGFRADLERKQGFCRRHVAELRPDRSPRDRRHPRVLDAAARAIIDDARSGSSATASGRAADGSASDFELARTRPPCVACAQGETAVETAVGRFDRAARVDPAWADALGDAAFCLDDFLAALGPGAAPDPRSSRSAARQLARFEDLRRRLDGFAHHSSHDRRPADDRRGTDAPPTRPTTRPRRRPAARPGGGHRPRRASNDPRVAGTTRGVRDGARWSGRRRPAVGGRCGSRRDWRQAGCHGVPSIGRR